MLWIKWRAMEVSKLFYLIDLDEIYQMRHFVQILYHDNPSFFGTSSVTWNPD